MPNDIEIKKMILEEVHKRN